MRRRRRRLSKKFLDKSHRGQLRHINSSSAPDFLNCTMSISDERLNVSPPTFLSAEVQLLHLPYTQKKAITSVLFSFCYTVGGPWTFSPMWS